MTDTMSQSELKWAMPNPSARIDHPPVKRPSSPGDTGRERYKSQKSVSDVLGPEMARVHLVISGQSAPSHGGVERLSPTLLSEAAALIGAGLEGINDGEGVEEIQAEGDSHRVRKLIQIFEHSGQDEASEEGEGSSGCLEVEERISSNTVTQEESLPGRIVTKTVHKVKEAAKMVGHTMVEGVKQSVLELRHGFHDLVKKFHLPQSSLENRPDNNVHVRHPDKLIGGMVGLGMHIQKDANGHRIRSVISEGLAAKAKLREDDIIVSVSGSDVTSLEFEELQQLFGSLGEVEFNIVVIREQEDENGTLVRHQLTVSIKLCLEGDQVMVDIDISVHYYQWEWNGESEPYYIFQNQDVRSVKYLMLKDGCFRMSTTNDLTLCRFKLYFYTPVDNGPRAFINVTNGLPLDHKETTRIGVNDSALRHKLVVSDDNRIFYAQKQDNTARYTFQLASRKNFYLTADDMGNLTTSFFPHMEAVDGTGQFNMELKSRVDKMSPPEIQKYDPKSQGSLNGKDKYFDLRK